MPSRGPAPRVVFVGVAVIGLKLLFSAPQLPGQTAAVAVTWLVTVSFVVVGVMLLVTDVPAANGWGCILAALSTIPGDLNDAHFAGHPLPVVLGYVLEPVYLVAVSALVLRYPRPRLAAPERRLLALLFASGVVSRIATALTSGKLADDFYRPPTWSTLPVDAWWHDDVFVRGGRTLIATLLVVAAVLLARRLRSAHGLTRQSQAALVVVGILCALAAAADQLVWAIGTETVRALPAALVRNMSAALIPVALLADLLRRRAAGAAISHRVLAAALTGSPDHLQEALRDVFVDPTLSVETPDTHDGWLDTHGAPVARGGPRAGRRHEVLAVNDPPTTLRISFDSRAVQDEALVAAAMSAIRVGAQSNRLQTDLVTALAEVNSSRERIVAAGLAERRQVERNLHDGAQQQLLAVAATLAQSDLIDDTELRRVVMDARAGLRDALAELRALARGIHPAALIQGGLAAALPTLRDRAPWPVSLRVELGPSPLPEVLESTVYFLVAELLVNAARHAQAHAAHVCVLVADEVLTVIVRDDGIGGAHVIQGGGLAGLRDRVEALGGSLTVAGGEGSVVQATLPVRAEVSR